MPHAVDEESGSSGYTGQVGRFLVLADVRRADVLAQVGPELRGVQAQRAGVPDQVAYVERALVIEEQVAHLPERVLPAGRLGGLGGELRMRMDVGQRQVPPHVPDVAEVMQQ